MDNGTLIRPYFSLGKGSNLTTISQMGWLSHQLTSNYVVSFADLPISADLKGLGLGNPPITIPSTSGPGYFKEIPAILAG